MPLQIRSGQYSRLTGVETISTLINKQIFPFYWSLDIIPHLPS
jgi:hypothetical protein